MMNRNFSTLNGVWKKKKTVGRGILITLCTILIILACIAISIGIWTLAAALPIMIGSLIFPYSFKWIYALAVGTVIWFLSLIFKK